jgi:DNA-binding GntR family transcriptional regulator
MTAVPETPRPHTVAHRTKRELAIVALREAVITGRYRAGEQLSQNEIAAELGLSATPVREAFRELLAQGLLVQRAHHSVRVADVDLDALRQIYDVRALLEGHAASLEVSRMTAATRGELKRLHGEMDRAQRRGDQPAVRAADEAFHSLLYATAGNAALVQLIGQLWSSFPRYQLWAIPGRTASSVAEHRQVLNAILAGNAGAAAEAMQEHLRQAFAALERSLAPDTKRRSRT